MTPAQQKGEVLRWDQCQLALRTILDALPEHGGLPARDVAWLRSVALSALGEDPSGARLVIVAGERLRALLDAARAVIRSEWDMVDPQHRTFAHQFPEMLDAIRRLRDVAEAAGDIAPPTTWSGRHHECRTCGMFADVEDAIMHTARCPYGRLQSALQRWKEVTW